jgi:hypothetical protein
MTIELLRGDLRAATLFERTSMICLIWGTECEDKSPIGGNFFLIDSPRAGGLYKLLSSAQGQMMGLTDDQKRAVTTWIVSQHRAGFAVPKIDTSNIDEIKTLRGMNFSERVDRSLMFIGGRTKVGGSIALNIITPQNKKTVDEFLAFTETDDVGEAQSFLKMLGENMELVGCIQETLFHLKPKGWLRLDELQAKEVRTSQAFVAMWFDARMDEPYKNGLHKAIYDSGYDPRRVDQAHHHLNKVDDEIIAEIRRSRFIVVDCTCETGKARGSVYFEAGFALGLNIPIIWTCRNTSLKDLQFDTRQYPHITWDNSDDLYAKLRARVGALVGDGPKIRARAE